MDDIFLKILNMSISAIWIILEVLVLRVGFGIMGKFKSTLRSPKWLYCLLWATVGLRLVLPFSIETKYSLIPVSSSELIRTEAILEKTGKEADLLEKEIAITETTADTKSKPSIPEKSDNSGDAYTSGNQTADRFEEDISDMILQSDKYSVVTSDSEVYVSESMNKNEETGEETIRTTADTANSMRLVLHIAEAVWVIGIAAVVLYAVINLIRLSARIREAVPFNSTNGFRKSIHNNHSRVCIFICDGIDSPFVLGIFCPKIYLPSEYLLDKTGRRAEYVIAHEFAHIERGDNARKILGMIILALHWFNPLVWLSFFLFCRDIELACDEKVISSMDNRSRMEYADTLFSSGMKRRLVFEVPLNFSENGVKERIREILDYRKSKIWVIAGCTVICGILAFAFLTDPVQGETIEEVSENLEENSENPDILSDTVITGTEVISNAEGIIGDDKGNDTEERHYNTSFDTITYELPSLDDEWLKTGIRNYGDGEKVGTIYTEKDGFFFVRKTSRFMGDSLYLLDYICSDTMTSFLNSYGVREYPSSPHRKIYGFLITVINGDGTCVSHVINRFELSEEGDYYIRNIIGEDNEGTIYFYISHNYDSFDGEYHYGSYREDEGCRLIGKLPDVCRKKSACIEGNMMFFSMLPYNNGGTYGNAQYSNSKTVYIIDQNKTEEYSFSTYENYIKGFCKDADGTCYAYGIDESKCFYIERLSDEKVIRKVLLDDMSGEARAKNIHAAITEDTKIIYITDGLRLWTFADGSITSTSLRDMDIRVESIYGIEAKEDGFRLFGRYKSKDVVYCCVEEERL